MDLGGDEQVTTTYADYLLRGRTPRKTQGPCKPNGSVIKMVKVTPIAAGAGAGLRSAGKSAAAAPRSLQDAAVAGDIQYIGLPAGGGFAVLDDTTPVNLTLGTAGAGSELVVTRYVDGVVQSEKSYTSLAGTLTVTGSGGTTAVAADGTPVQPDGSGAGGGGEQPGGGDQSGGGAAEQPGAGGGDQPSTGGGSAGGSGSGPAVTGATATTPAKPATSTKPATTTKPTKKPLRCRKGYVKKKVKGRQKCVKRKPAKKAKVKR
jgi:hypothetical protein